ncbi:MAG: glycoside hydrolase family 3 C-terminal domain-containing protein [Clostridiales bacterium]|nr:glycoside hydrolase family 3 C-terminal domain-containing protein [Clostridiales bacterium]
MKHSKLWTGLSSVVAILLVVSILATQCMLGYSATINDMLGITTSEIVSNGDSDEDTTYYESAYGELNYDNLQLLIADTYSHAVTEEEEGAVLLKNEDNALPLSSDELRVTLFGHAVVQPLYRIAAAGSKGYQGEYNIDLYTALTNAGFAINDTLWDAYENSDVSRSTGGSSIFGDGTDWSMGEVDISFYTDDLRSSWEDDYNDVAIVMFAREGAEGSDLYVEDPSGISQLALHQEEKDLMEMLQSYKEQGVFDKIIVLVNSGWAMELGWLDEYDVDACLWIGLPGQRGFEGVANLLIGEANPSGKLQDTYAVDSTSAPAVVNAGYNDQTWTNIDEVDAGTSDDLEDLAYYTVQAESIYIGYKYYETRYEDAVMGQGNADSTVGSSNGGAWNYTGEVTFPYGYGLSYTTFEQTLDSVVIDGEDITVTVTVTNTGTVAGKSVVQVYAQTPYGTYEKTNLVEKSAIQLLDFGKTDMLEPGESQTLEIVCDKYLLASYDYTNVKGYIISEGDYYISIGDDAHDALNNVLAAKGYTSANGMVAVDGSATDGNAAKTYRWTEEFDATTYSTSEYTGAVVTNQFDECDLNYWIEDAVVYLSRNDWEGTYPTEATQVAATEEMMEVLDGEYYEKADDALSVSDITQGDNQGIPLAAMIGLDYDDPEWETYLNQFTIEELASLLQDSSGTAEIASVGVPAILIGDGPDGIDKTFSNYGDDRSACCYPCELILSSTFNRDLMYERGELLGEEYLYTGATEAWMPGVDLHRTPFGGRNAEYYSEDANVSYLCAIPVVEAFQTKGINAGPKHVAGNDQETHRTGVSTFFNEQAFREGSLRGVEGGVAAAGATLLMHGYNRLGMKWCSASIELCTYVIEDEWGFVGKQISDCIAPGYTYFLHFASSLEAGCDCYCLDFAGLSPASVVAQIEETDDGDLLNLLRDAAHDDLYIAANSALMNGYSADSTIVSVTPWWQPTMYAIIAVCAVLEVLCLAMMLRKNLKKNPDKEA